MRFSVIVTALFSVSTVTGEPLLRAARKEFADLLDGPVLKGKGAMDLSCFLQVWNSKTPDKDCNTKKDKAGSACSWCAGPKDIEMFSKAGACVTTGQISFLEDKGMTCAKKDEKVKPGVEESDAVMMNDFAMLGLDVSMPDVSCFKQVWKSETANTDCAGKKDKAGVTCQWCDVSAEIKKYAEENPKIKDLMDNIPQAEDIVDKAGYCVTGKQTSFLETKGVSCGTVDKKIVPTKPKVE